MEVPMFKNNKLRSLSATTAATAILLTAAPLAGATSNYHDYHHDKGNDNEHVSVTLCHSTGSSSNPYVQITTNANGAIFGHAGSQHQGGKDIIPPFMYNSHGNEKSFPGQNWDTQGQTIFNNGCKVGGQGGGGNGGNGGGNQNNNNNQTQTQSQTQVVNTTPAATTNNTATVAGQGGGQVSVPTAPQTVAPQGAVSAGEGGGATGLSMGALVGLLGSIGSLFSGLVLSKR